MTGRIALAGWFGSDNLGDELILHALAKALEIRGAEPLAVTIDPARTGRDHGIATVAHRSPAQSRSLVRALRAADGLVIAGGVVQSETSPWNLPFHTSRLRAAAAAGCPAVAAGLGVGRVTGWTGRSVARRGLARLTRTVVRDHDSARRLHQWGHRDVAVGADPVIALEVPPVEPTDTMCVILRPPNRRGLRTARAKAASRTPDTHELDQIAAAVDAAAAATGLAPRLVAFQASRDSELHREVGQRLTSPAGTVTPSLHNALTEVGRSRLVLTMRYHGAIAALVHGRPAVLLDYSPKMSSLAAEAGGWAPLVDPGRLDAGELAAAATTSLACGDRAEQARAELRGRLDANDTALDELVDGAA